MSIFSKIFSGQSSALDTYRDELEATNGFKDEVATLSQEQIQQEVRDFKLKVKDLNSQDEIRKELHKILPRVFALTREAAKRSIGQFHYDVQIVGGAALSNHKIAEMKTGEGKTLTATLPLTLYGLAGKGAHLVTVNDYLARWQASLMGPVYHYLGLSVASIQHEASFLYDPGYNPEQTEIEQLQGQTQGLVMDVKHMRPVSRREAYRADITYGTNNEFGFDYLRDNMVQHAQQLVQRELFFAIVDEVDSILIDEARTPLIISMPDSEPTSKYYDFARMVDRLVEETDYTVDEKHKAASLTDAGITKIEQILKVPNIYDTSKGVTTIHHIEQALRARALFKKDRDYVVREGEIVIVDEFTGRLMFGRRYSEGLHQAIEAKENVKIQQESKTLATITFQNLFRLYMFLSGMTGTAKTEEEEFFKIYQLTVEQIPTNKPMIRDDRPDLVYKTEDAKFRAIAREIKQRHQKGQPVLIGTVSIAKNEMLAEYLKKEGLKFEILNAKNHEREAHIISQAGRYKSITLATNIAGRGVDILLGGNPIQPEEAEAVRQAGGLHILGTERHESRRIDNQLRGRAGRQGDSGSSQFFVSMEDDLMRLFGGDRMKNLMNSLGLPDDQPIEARLVSKSIESAQKKIEGLNFDTRKHVLEFDDVLNHQRNIIYKRRRKYVPGTEESKDFDLKQEILNLVKEEVGQIVTLALNLPEEAESKADPVDEIAKQVGTIIPVTPELIKKAREAAENAADKEFAVTDTFYQSAREFWDVKEKEMGFEVFDGAQRFVSLQALDTLWMEHLDTMDHLRDSVRLRGYGQRDPLVEYKKEGFAMFQRMIAEINKQIVYSIFHVNVQVAPKADSPKNLVTNLSDAPSGGGSSSSDPKYQGVGRNDPCPCGSGKKFKKCHGKNL
ncbi:MAG: preprotein translocase subunit SecA [Patescibacteria group bacterium]|nr:preprotein translocase subunit SecA [Patescibacteria group bacterium]